MSIFSAKKAEEAGLPVLPRHIAIILDGNGRWAQRRGLPRTAGHAAGAETFRRIATYCRDIGVSYLTVYAFSTENWKRPKEEIDAIMSLLGKYLREAVDTMERDHIRLKILGDPTILPPELREIVAKWDRLPESLRAAILAIARADDGWATQEGGRGRKRPQARADRTEGGQA